MRLGKHRLLVSVVAATALMLCRGMDTSTTTDPATTSTTEPPDTSTPGFTTTTTYTTTANTGNTNSDNTGPIGPNSNSGYETADHANQADAALADHTDPAKHTETTVADQDAPAAHADSETEGIGKTKTGTEEHTTLSHDDSKDDKKCSYKYVNKNKYDPRTDTYDNVTDAMEKAFKNSPLAMKVFIKYINPKASLAAASLHAVPIKHPDLLGTDSSVQPSEPKSSGAGSDSAASPTRQKSKQTAKIEDPAKDFDVNRMFDKISSNANGFSHPITRFGSHIIRPHRRIGFQSNFLNDASQSPFLGGFGNMFLRKKRMAVPPSPKEYNGQQPQSLCKPNRKMLTAFMKSDHLCYLYKPHVQGIEMDLCKQQSCSVCSGQSSAQCVPKDLSAWVWAYCPHQGEEVTPEYIEYPAYCSCMVMHC